MKKNVFSFSMKAILCLLSIMQFSCANNADLKLAIETADKKCPIDIGVVGQVSSITYEENTVVYLFDVNEQVVNIEALKSDNSVLKQSMSSMFSNSSGAVKELLKMIVDANANLKIIYRGRTNQNAVECKFNTSEIKKMMSGEDSNTSNASKLESLIKESNLQMPQDLGGGIVMESMTMEDDGVFYNYAVDTNLVDIEVISEKIMDVKNSMIEALSQEVSIAELLNLCIEGNKCLVYRYHTPDGRTADVKISIDELKSIYSAVKEKQNKLKD